MADELPPAPELAGNEVGATLMSIGANSSNNGQVQSRGRPASARPASAVSSNRFPFRPSSAKPSMRPASAKPSSAMAIAFPKALHKKPEKPVATIAGALKEITVQERKLEKLAITEGRPSTANSSASRQHFIPARSTSLSPPRPMSPRRDIIKTLQQTRLDGPLTLEGNEEMLVRVFRAKCLDLNLKPTDERKTRFFELAAKNSKDGWLALRETGLGPLAGAAVAAMLMQQGQYCGLDVGGNNLKDEGMTVLAEMLAKDQSLTTLDAKSNDVGVEGGTMLFRALSRNSTLTDLDLGILAGGNRNRIGTKVAPVMREMLVANTTLTSLSLYGNGLGTEGCVEFSAGLEKNTVLKNLDLGLNSLKCDGTVTLAVALERGALEMLNLANNGIQTRGIRSIANALSSGNLLLQTLDLSFNTLSDRSCDLLGAALANNSLLQTLNLHKTAISQEGCVNLAPALVSRSLSSLVLSSNEVRDDGAAALAKMLKRNTALTRLDLSSNQVADVGATQIASMLHHNSGLTSLSLSDNRVGDAGGLLIGNALLANGTLRSMNLKGNLLHDLTGSAMLAGLRENTGLTELDVSWNDICYSNFKGIERLILEHAMTYREGAVPRLKKELARLRKEEPKLAIREAELLEISEERDAYAYDAQRLAEEIQRTKRMEKEKLEECAVTLAEARADQEVRKAELKAVVDEHRDLVKIKGKELASLQNQVDMVAKEIGRMHSEKEHADFLVMQNQECQEEEAEHQVHMEALMAKCEAEAQHLKELKAHKVELEALLAPAPEEGKVPEAAVVKETPSAVMLGDAKVVDKPGETPARVPSKPGGIPSKVPDKPGGAPKAGAEKKPAASNPKTGKS